MSCARKRQGRGEPRLTEKEALRLHDDCLEVIEVMDDDRFIPLVRAGFVRQVRGLAHDVRRGSRVVEVCDD